MLFYFQNSATVLSIVSLLHDAKQHINKFPSMAIDSGTQERTTIHLLTRMLNNMCSSSEYSGTQAVSHALGLAANFTMHKKIFLFVDMAMQYVNDFHHPNSDARTRPAAPRAATRSTARPRAEATAPEPADPPAREACRSTAQSTLQTNT